MLIVSSCSPMNYEPVDRPPPSVGAGCRITGRPGVHQIVALRKDPSRPAMQVACSPRWYSTMGARMVDDAVDCEKCGLKV